MVCHFGIPQVCLSVFKIIFFSKFPFVEGELLSVIALIFSVIIVCVIIRDQIKVHQVSFTC